MSWRWWVSFGIYIGLLLRALVGSSVAQDEPGTADEVINRYLSAIGAERFATITTFSERGEIYGNLAQLQQSPYFPAKSQSKEHGTFEFYFKSPNLRYSSTLTANNVVISMHGCDGKLSWYIDPFLKLTEFKPKPDNEYDCENGLELDPLGHHLKMRLTKKKKIDGHMMWEVKVEDPKSSWAGHYYFDADTFLLFRRSQGEFNITYSDYREVAGIKVPFTTVTDYGSSTIAKLISTVRELKINAPIDDARFIEPHPINGVVTARPEVAAKTNGSEKTPSAVPSPETSNAGPAVAKDKSTSAGVTDFPKSSASAVAPPGDGASVTEVNFPNFTSCNVTELQLAVPELRDLKPVSNQEELAGLLGKIGATTLDVARHTPNLISNESVTESVKGLPDVHHDYDYLIVTRPHGNVVGLTEFRVDVRTGDKFQTESVMKDDSAAWAELERASHNLTSSEPGAAPVWQGFAASWVFFYPNNRLQTAFRYLGTQKLSGKHTLVLAFAQKPELVGVPAIFRYLGKVAPMFLQGVAWVDPASFRILRLRTELLSPIPEVSLHRMTADIQFAATKVEDVQSELWLPRDVAVTSECDGTTLHEVHRYSRYRLFRAQSRIVLNP